MNNDEIRRQLRAADQEQRATMPRWREALHRVMEDKTLSTDDKAAILGVPQRRQFLKLGGMTVAGAAVLAACGSDSKSANDTSSAGATGGVAGTTPSSGDTGTTDTGQAGSGAATDLVLAKTAVSLENLAVAVYDAALKLNSFTYDPSVADAAKLFRDQHQEHADALNAVIKGAGEPEYKDPNKYLMDNVVTPGLPTLTSQDAVLKFASNLESTAASTYAYAASKLSTAKLRQTIMSIGGVESRHFTVLQLSLDPTGVQAAVPLAFTNTEVGTQAKPGRVPDAAVLTS